MFVFLFSPVSTPGNPTDYVTITVADGSLEQFNDETPAQNVSVVITDDLLFEQTESFSVSLILPAGQPQSVVISQDVTVVSILDNDRTLLVILCRCKRISCILQQLT